MMAEKLGIIPSAYGNYETGFSRPPYEVLYQLSKILGVTVDDLLFRDLVALRVKAEKEAEITLQQRLSRGYGIQDDENNDNVKEPAIPYASEMTTVLRRLTDVIEKLNNRLG
jgi:transcriptional regulator with XRE-family HTH domain